MVKTWVMGNGTAVVQSGSGPTGSYLEMGKWYRSKDKKQIGTSFGSAMINKKWVLEEQFNVNMMRFQQVKYI